LEDISVYTVNEDMRLVDVFVALKAKGDAPEAKGDLKEVRKYLVEAINLDSERVYDNDIKKLMNWFHLLKDVLDFEKLKASQTNGSETAEEVGTEEVKEKKVAKAAAVKTEVKKQVKTATPKANSKANNSNKTTFRQKSV
jgi:hypothetical protein